MKTTDNLMRGDWVRIDDIDTQIKCIYKYEVDTYDLDEVEIESVEPIAITRTILEKNGFFSDGNELEYESENIIILFYIDSSIVNVTINESLSIDIKYVHELQHILNLFKINKTISL